MDIAVVLNSSAEPVVGQSDIVMRGMAQDLDNMLAVIASGLVSIERGTDPQQLSRLLAGMRHAIRNAASMSDDIAELSVGPMVTPERVSLAVILRELEERARAILGEGVDLRTEIARDLWPIHVVPSYLRFALRNLLANAADAMPKGGTLVVRAFNTLRSPSTPACFAGDFVRLEVVDTGEGIAPDALSRAFEPFFTTRQSLRRTGLGLGQVQRFASQFGGDVTLQSELGVGTRVIFHLPRATAACR
ncbi:hypothetical protein SPKIRA_33110 [Sphingomonas paucimobilis]|uniref:sensor histidine kinase n=2 Tax=Sphingomonas paucimobilis TaxID=13689 RepID=UPI0015DC8FE1|nr:hypothetical protein SPKIRA_33110 [Sphingomonas paucimobilis]